MFTVDIKVCGAPETIKKHQKLPKDLGDWTPEMKVMGRFFKSFFQNDVYETEGAVFGYPWKALSPRYRDYKRKKAPGRGVLERSGKLRKGWTFDPDKTSVTIENKVKYGYYHQSTKARKKLPRRPLMRFDKKREEYIVNTLKEGIIDRMRKML